MNIPTVQRRNPLSRREFLAVATSVGLAGLAPSMAFGRYDRVTSEDIDLIVHNAKVYTVDPGNPIAQAFAIKSGRFAAIGNSDEVKGLAVKKTRLYDARGMCVLPGFIDTHNHGSGETLLYNVLVGNRYDVEFVTIDSIVEKLRVRARTLPPDNWVEGYFFDDTKIKQAVAQREGSRPGLDRASRRGSPSRRSHRVLQQQGISKRGYHSEYSPPVWRHV